MTGCRTGILLAFTAVLFTSQPSAAQQDSAPDVRPNVTALFVQGACAIRTFPNETENPPTCSQTCALNEYMDLEQDRCTACPEGQYAVLGPNRYVPIGPEACEPEVTCIEPTCDRCSLVPLQPDRPGPIPMRCQCNEGYKSIVENVWDPVESKGTPYYRCVRDCRQSNGGCAQKCERGDAGEPDTCVCGAGFNSEQDGKVCTDINECTNGAKCFYPHSCSNFPGSYECKCANGFVSTTEGTQCTRAEQLVCTLSMPEITLPDQSSPYSTEALQTEFAKLDTAAIEAIFQEATPRLGYFSTSPVIQVYPTFANGVLEVQVQIQYVPALWVPEEARLLALLTARLTATGYGILVEGEITPIATPISCFSSTTGGAVVPIENSCSWFKGTNFCLQNSQCLADFNNQPYCWCARGWNGKRCDFADFSRTDIVIIVLIVLLFILLSVLASSVCLMWRGRDWLRRSPGKVYVTSDAKVTPAMQQQFATAYPGSFRLSESKYHTMYQT